MLKPKRQAAQIPGGSGPCGVLLLEGSSRTAACCDVEEGEGGEVGKERPSMVMVSHGCPFKGAVTEWIAASLGRHLSNLGMAEKWSRTSAGGLVEDAQRRRVERNSQAITTYEHILVRDLKSSGCVERRVQSFEWMFRTHTVGIFGGTTQARC